MAVARLIATRFRDFKVSETRPVIGGSVEISGYLEGNPIVGWYGLDGRAVRVVADRTTIISTTTSAEGYFKVLWRPSSTGKFIVKAVFDGDLLNDRCESVEVEVTVLTEEEKAKEEQAFWIMVGGLALVSIVGVAAVAYMISEERRMQMLLAARRK